MTAPTMGSPVTSSNTSLTPSAALDGLVVLSKYSDSSCTTSLLLSTSVTGLNVCTRAGVSSYQLVTATESSALFGEYSDSFCSLLVSSTVLANTNGACVAGIKVFVSPAMTYTAYAVTAEIR